VPKKAGLRFGPGLCASGFFRDRESQDVPSFGFEVFAGNALKICALDGEISLQFGVDQVGVFVKDVIPG
jgi:hypothetical protein